MMALGVTAKPTADGAISVVTCPQSYRQGGRLDCARVQEEGELLTTHVGGDELQREEWSELLTTDGALLEGWARLQVGELQMAG